MKETLEQLIGIREEKPFECVGSRAEINTAMVLTIQRMEEEGEMLPALLSYYKGTGLYKPVSYTHLAVSLGEPPLCGAGKEPEPISGMRYGLYQIKRHRPGQA